MMTYKEVQACAVELPRGRENACEGEIVLSGNCLVQEVLISFTNK